MYNAILVLNPVKPLVLSAPKDGTVSFLVNYKNGGGGAFFAIWVGGGGYFGHFFLELSIKSFLYFYGAFLQS